MKKPETLEEYDERARQDREAFEEAKRELGEAMMNHWLFRWIKPLIEHIERRNP